MIDNQIPKLDEDQQTVTISIGGNDLGFSNILKACVFKPGGPISDNCDDKVDEAYNFLWDKTENGF